MPEPIARPASPRWLVIAAFAAIYLIWGSAYLAIRFAIETVPPLMMAGMRFVIAGGLLYAWTRLRGAARPTARNWWATSIIGVLLLGGNGAVTWAEQWVPSGLTALLIATVPLWMVQLAWLRGGERPTLATASGLALGLLGILLLVGPNELLSGTQVDLVGAVAVLLGSLSWAAGSLYSRTAPVPAARQLGLGMEMLVGGAVLVAVGLVRGEGAQLDLSALSLRSAMAFVYLIVFGSIVAFTAYLWLLRATTPARAATYAYVNPVVAVFLGWALAGEPVRPLTLAATALIVTAVALIVIQETRSTSALAQPQPESAGVVRSSESSESINSAG
jgi:drug/metabolite transporter (DMT)-like permease